MWKSCCCLDDWTLDRKVISGARTRFGFWEFFSGLHSHNPDGTVSASPIPSDRVWLKKSWNFTQHHHYENPPDGWPYPTDFTNTMTLVLDVNPLNGRITIPTRDIFTQPDPVGIGGNKYLFDRFPSNLAFALPLNAPSYLLPGTDFPIPQGTATTTASATNFTYHGVQFEDFGGGNTHTTTTDLTIALGSPYTQEDFNKDMLLLTDNFQGATGVGFNAIPVNSFASTHWNEAPLDRYAGFLHWDYSMIYDTDPSLWPTHAPILVWPAPVIVNDFTQYSGPDAKPGNKKGVVSYFGAGESGTPILFGSNIKRTIARGYFKRGCCRHIETTRSGHRIEGARDSIEYTCAIISPDMEDGRLGISLRPKQTQFAAPWGFDQETFLTLYENYRTVPGTNPTGPDWAPGQDCCAPNGNPLP